MVPTPVYMDYSATTPADERVVSEMLPYFSTYFGNASSKAHSFGWRADGAVELARGRVSSLVGAQPREIVFTSGATEACNLALRGVLETYAVKGRHIITVRTEHKAVLDTCKILEKKGADITYLGVDDRGLIDTRELEAAIRADTVLVAAMFANNETGVIQNVAAIGEICKQKNTLFFCDATQAVGKVPINVNEMGIDLMAFSGHKMYGPKGMGALFIRSRNPRVKITAQITGGGQENGIRSGTLNVPAIVGFGKACGLCLEEMEEESARLRLLRERLQKGLTKIPGTVLNGHPHQRLPHVLNISFDGLNSGMLLAAFKEDIALSSGSACTSGSLDPSYVLTAMGIEKDRAKSALRFSIGRFTTQEEIGFVMKVVADKVAGLR